MTEYVVISGGWDNNVIFWDLRQRNPVGSVFGPHVCGESIDFKDQILYTGSYDTKNQLQFWDIRGFSLIRSENLNEDGNLAKVYTLQIQKNADKEFLAVGCSGNPQILCYKSAYICMKI